MLTVSQTARLLGSECAELRIKVIKILVGVIKGINEGYDCYLLLVSIRAGGWCVQIVYSQTDLSLCWSFWMSKCHFQVMKQIFTQLIKLILALDLMGDNLSSGQDILCPGRSHCYTGSNLFPRESHFCPWLPFLPIFAAEDADKQLTYWRVSKPSLNAVQAKLNIDYWVIYVHCLYMK